MLELLFGPVLDNLRLTRLKSNRGPAEHQTDNQIILPRGRRNNVLWTGGRAIEGVPGEAELTRRLRCHKRPLFYYPYGATGATGDHGSYNNDLIYIIFYLI